MYSGTGAARARFEYTGWAVFRPGLLWSVGPAAAAGTGTRCIIARSDQGLRPARSGLEEDLATGSGGFTKYVVAAPDGPPGARVRRRLASRHGGDMIAPLAGGVAALVAVALLVVTLVVAWTPPEGQSPATAAQAAGECARTDCLD